MDDIDHWKENFVFVLYLRCLSALVYFSNNPIFGFLERLFSLLAIYIPKS
jgi:hypothetical protein